MDVHHFSNITKLKGKKKHEANDTKLKGFEMNSRNLPFLILKRFKYIPHEEVMISVFSFLGDFLHIGDKKKEWRC
jgi:hypothetical protein